MADLFDEYIDQFTSNLGPYGVALSFQRTGPKPIAPGSTPQAAEVGTIRMSVEHLKSMAYVLVRQIRDAESQLGITIPVPHAVLNQLRIAPEDWESFWRRKE